MNIIVLTPVRLLGDGLAACFSSRPEVAEMAIVCDLAALRSALAVRNIQVVLIDVTQNIDLVDVRSIAVDWPEVPLIALGLTEVLQEVIKCGRAGFAGYIARDTTIDGLCQSLVNIAEGRLACPPEISSGMLRALFRSAPQSEQSLADPALTSRESEVLEHIGRGLSNKEIGKELCLSVSTVKHHVHNILGKLSLPSRSDAMRRVREAPWLGHASSKQ